MHRQAPLLALAISMILPAVYAQDSRTESRNFFSPPKAESEQIPQFTNRISGSRNSLGKDIPGWQQVRAIPSLSIKQRRELHDLFNKAREELQPLMQELKDKRVIGETGIPQVESAKSSHGRARRAREIRQQLVTRRQEIWQQVKSRLTSEQLQQLEQMRKGELVPSALKQRS
jgi:Spy/CpxP family protein refolding chaperone